MSKYQYETGLNGIKLISEESYTTLTPEENTLYIVKGEKGFKVYLGSLPLEGSGTGATLSPSTLLARAITTEPDAILATGEIIEETEET